MMNSVLVTIKKMLLHAFFPSRCCLCRRFVDMDRLICDSCMENLPFCECQSINKIKSPNIKSALAPFYYEMGIDNAVCDFKFKNNFVPANFLAVYMIQSLLNNTEDLSNYYLVPVPLYKTQLRKRGYNQSAILCDIISKKTGIPILKNSLIKIRKTKNQHKSDRQERYTNLINAFYCDNSVNNKNIILVDDVCTTGSTAEECAKTIKRAGGGNIILLVAATVRYIEN